MKPITLSADPALQKVVKFHDLHDDRFAVETVYDVQAIKDEATRVRNDSPANWHGVHHLVAQIPMPLYQQLRSQGIVQDPTRFKAWLNNPENAIFRTKHGRV